MLSRNAAPGSSRSSLAQDSYEKLPLYEPEHPSEPASSALSTTRPSLPNDSSPPASVRHFLSQTLIAGRNFAPEHAQAIAARWTVGSGRELRTYAPVIYLHVFGVEEGWILYADVRTLVLRAKDRKEGREARVGFTVAGIFCLLGSGSLTTAILLNKYAWLGVIGAIVAVISFLILLLGLPIFFLRETPEAKVEAEMRKAMEGRSVSDLMPRDGGS